MKGKFKVVKVRRYNKIKREMYELWYHDCTVKQAIVWGNRRNIEGAGPVEKYAAITSFDDVSNFVIVGYPLLDRKEGD